MNRIDKKHLAIQSCALLEAVRLFGSTAEMADGIGAKRSQVSNWINGVSKSNIRHRVKIPYHFAAQLSFLTGIDIHRFAPDTEYHQANKLLIPLLAKKVLQIKQIALKSIYVDCDLSHFSTLDLKSAKTTKKPLLISTDLELISNMARYSAFKQAGYVKVPVIRLDCSLLCRQSLDLSLLFSALSLYDQVMLGLWLEDMIKKQTNLFDQAADPQKKLCFSQVGELSFYYDLSSIYQKSTADSLIRADQIPNRSESEQALPPNNQTPHPLETFVASRVGFAHVDEYICAKHVIRHGCAYLVALVDNGRINLSFAAQVAALAQTEQLDTLRKKLGELA